MTTCKTIRSQTSAGATQGKRPRLRTKPRCVESPVRLQLGHAVAANPAGIVLVALAAVLLVKRPASVRVSLPLLAVVIVVMWAFELVRFGVL